MTQQNLLEFFSHLEGIMWGWPMLILLVATGLYLTFILKGLQFRALWPSLKLAFMPQTEKSEGDISHFQALMTALSATVGTGNIAGVATAISLGGPGALVWMWLTGFLGMATKFSEAVLGVYYRQQEKETGEMSGGPMYYILHGLNEFPLLKRLCIPKVLAAFFAGLIVIAAINIGNMVQANSVADAISNVMRGSDWSEHTIKLTVGIAIAAITAVVIIGGIKRIGAVASGLVPVMIALYVGAGLYILGANWSMIDDVFRMIFSHAFSDIAPAAAGGFAGAAVKEVMQFGLSRGAFSNESGLGTAPIAAAAAKTPHPVEQALVSMTQTFIDTIVVCTFTGLIIILSGLWYTSDPNLLTGAALTSQSFGRQLPLHIGGLPLGELIVAVCLVFFAYSTIIGWYYYGEKGINYLAGQKSVWAYRGVYIVCLVLGAIQPVPLIWTVASVLIAFMIFPNLLSLLLLSGKVKRLTDDFFQSKKTGAPFTLQAFFHDIEKHTK